jgi:hypothetical protein
MTEQYEKVVEWNSKWNSGTSSMNVPVAYCPNPEEEDPEDRERCITTAYGMAFLSTPKDGSDPQAVVRLMDYGVRGYAPLDHLEVLEEVLAALRRFGKVDGDEAIHHNPECPDCYVEMNWDEGFDCPVCLTHFGDNGEFSYKVCVEYDCCDWAEMLGDDGQPRCTTCSVLILAGEQKPFAPYECKRCKVKVVGIPSQAKAAKNRLCGSHQAAEDRQAFMDEIIGKRY